MRAVVENQGEEGGNREVVRVIFGDKRRGVVRVIRGNVSLIHPPQKQLLQY